MGKHILATIKIMFITFLVVVSSTTAYAWGDSDGGRPSYSLQEIDEKAEEFGNTPFFNSITVVDSDYVWHQQVFGESIPVDTVTHEKNYVGAREDTGINAGSQNQWYDNDIAVEDGKTYIIRMYVHNNNPNGWDAVAEDTKVRFNVPVVSSREIKVNGYITSSNASPSEYVDDVIFTSDQAFHLEYIYGSALLENNKVGLNGIQLSDDIVEAKKGGVLIGYDALDGRIPGCYEYDNYVTIQVRAVFDDEFSVQQKVRIAGNSDKTWKYAINANIGDIIEIQFEYRNISSDSHCDVSVRDILPNSLRYIQGSTKLYNTSYPDGVEIDQDDIVSNGIIIGNYAPGANAFVRFRAEVVGDTMAYGANELVNWTQVQAGSDKQIIIQDYAKVYVVKIPEKTLTSLEIILIILVLICFVLLILCAIKINKLRHPKS